MLARVKKTGIATILIPTEAPGTSFNSIANIKRFTIQRLIRITNSQMSKMLAICAMKISLSRVEG
jgi:hypothetical protein